MVYERNVIIAVSSYLSVMHALSADGSGVGLLLRTVGLSGAAGRVRWSADPPKFLSGAPLVSETFREKAGKGGPLSRMRMKYGEILKNW